MKKKTKKKQETVEKEVLSKCCLAPVETVTKPYFVDVAYVHYNVCTKCRYECDTVAVHKTVKKN